MTDFLGILIALTGIVFFFAGSVGLLRLPDLYSRLHALTKADNLGLGLLCLGLALIDGDPLNALKLFLIWLLVLAASAGSAHMLAQKSMRKGVR